jgi:hypothetical protein
VTQIGNGNIACVQTAVQQNIVSQGNGNAQANVAGDNIIANTNINAQAISQECNIEVEQVNEVAKTFLTVNEAGDVVVVKKRRLLPLPPALPPALPPTPLLLCSTSTTALPRRPKRRPSFLTPAAPAWWPSARWSSCWVAA